MKNDFSKLIYPIGGRHEWMAISPDGKKLRNWTPAMKHGAFFGYHATEGPIHTDNLFISTNQRQNKSMIPNVLNTKPPFVSSMMVKAKLGTEYYRNFQDELRKVFVIDIDLTDQEKTDIENPKVWERAIADTEAVAKAVNRRYDLDGCTVMCSGGGFYVVVWPKQHGFETVETDFWFKETDEILSDAKVALKHNSDKTTATFRGVFRVVGSLNRKYPTKMCYQGYPTVKIILNRGWDLIKKGKIHPWKAIGSTRLTIQTIKGK